MLRRSASPPILHTHVWYFLSVWFCEGPSSNLWTRNTRLLNRGVQFFPVPVRTRELGIARQVRPSRPASSCSSSTLRLNLVLAHGIPPAPRDGMHLFIQSSAIAPVPNLSSHAVGYLSRSPPRCLRRDASIPKVVSVMGAAFSGMISH